MKQRQNCLALILSLCALPALALGVTNITCTAVVPFASANATAVSTALYSAVLPGNIIYWRAGTFTPATSWENLTSSTQEAAATARGLILDLRSNTSPEDFGGALQVAGFLTRDQAGTPFQPAAYRPTSAAMAMLIVLTNRETRGAAETLARALQAQGALVMGQATEGAHPVTPDVTTTANAKDEAVSLALIDRRQVASVITETAVRQRMSEAALVKGQDPEQDAFIASHEQATASVVAETRDMALVEALDSFKAIRVVEGQESSPPTRIVSSPSVAGQAVIASSGLSR